MAVKVTDENFKQEVLESNLPVMVDFWAEWCSPCLMVAPAVEDIAKEYKGRLKVVKANVDESPNTTSEYGITGIPTLMIFKNGELAERVVGAQPKSQLELMIKRHI